MSYWMGDKPTCTLKESLMKSFEVRRTIAASPQQVWAILTNARALESGGCDVLRLEGQVVPPG